MISSRFLAGMALCALTASVFAQGKGGVSGPLNTSPAASKGGRDLLRPQSNPGLAAPLDIRIQGEGLSLPPGVSEDEPASEPADDRSPKSSPPPENPSQPDAKRP